jgi:hypothetical protein
MASGLIWQMASGYAYQRQSRDNKFYGTTKDCSYCQAKETLNHVFTYPSETTTSGWSTSNKQLLARLSSIHSPPAVTDAISHGILMWTQHHPSLPPFNPPTDNAVCPTDVCLRQAYSEQSWDVGWDQF